MADGSTVIRRAFPQTQLPLKYRPNTLRIMRLRPLAAAWANRLQSRLRLYRLPVTMWPQWPVSLRVARFLPLVLMRTGALRLLALDITSILPFPTCLQCVQMLEGILNFVMRLTRWGLPVHG